MGGRFFSILWQKYAGGCRKKSGEDAFKRLGSKSILGNIG